MEQYKSKGNMHYKTIENLHQRHQLQSFREEGRHLFNSCYDSQWPCLWEAAFCDASTLRSHQLTRFCLTIKCHVCGYIYKDWVFTCSCKDASALWISMGLALPFQLSVPIFITEPEHQQNCICWVLIHRNWPPSAFQVCFRVICYIVISITRQNTDFSQERVLKPTYQQKGEKQKKTESLKSWNKQPLAKSLYTPPHTKRILQQWKENKDSWKKTNSGEFITARLTEGLSQEMVR